MFLTRLGFGAKAVVTGDITQIDSAGRTHFGPHRGHESRRWDRRYRFVRFDERDVVRHKLVQHIVKAY